MNLDFLPSAERGRQLDARMRSELRASLEHIGAQLDESPAAIQLRELALQLPDACHSPLIFGRYYRLGEAALDGAEGAALVPLIDALVQTELEAGAPLAYTALSALEMGEADHAVVIECVDTDPDLTFQFLPPRGDRKALTQASIERALALGERVMPEFAGEFRALVRVIYLASAPDEVDAARFDGASSYRLWGGLVLNVDDDKSDLEMLETLAHEAGHCFLFGLTVSEPLTRSDGRVFQSPLRTDARPLDGIYHATYVSARMHAVVLAAKESGILSGTQMLEADKLLQASARAFYGGDSVLRGEPGVTPLGESILEWARAFMNAAAPEAAAAS